MFLLMIGKYTNRGDGMEESRKKYFVDKLKEKQRDADIQKLAKNGDVYLQGYSDGIKYAIDIFTYMFFRWE